ncbi:putative apoptosis-inducing TAF9-like domain 1 family protein [Sphaerosporella brunnea]|uniref:Putative apoptosis-inducing TAF9-like domain 1 family protein n=1 Tax=Sphaerosporella brunnea TaxID=1250544 RepID=A0A5J5F070_9PEZI|nr:putative apoptosis-inducing TAF9-like domain 1 family protein [Sphaerosporella brunnea]
MATDENDDNYRDRLKSALWYSVGKAVDNESMRLRVNATPQFIAALAELVFTQVDNVAKDLESFAHHANRSTISTADVLLLARRNEDLGTVLENFINDDKAERERESVVTKGKGKVAAGKGRGKK